MTNDQSHGGALGAVYAAKRPEEVAALYDGWAETYDAEMAASGYCHPSVTIALLARHLPRGAGPVLDAGCGTGLVGQWLGILGYDDLEGLDISTGMLARAEAKAIYRRLHRLALGTALPFEDGHFAGIVSAGVFTTGHVGAEGLDELVRICRPGGVLVLTVKNTVWDAGVKARIGQMIDEGRLALAEETDPYVSMPGDKATIPGRGVVLKRF